MTPLEMARNAAVWVEKCAAAQDADPVRAYVDQAGSLGHEAAYLAACMALVSIAEDLHRRAGDSP